MVVRVLDRITAAVHPHTMVPTAKIPFVPAHVSTVAIAHHRTCAHVHRPIRVRSVKHRFVPLRVKTGERVLPLVYALAHLNGLSHAVYFDI